MRKSAGSLNAKDWDCPLSLGEVGWYRMDGKLFSELVAKIPTIISFEPLILSSCLFMQGLGRAGCPSQGRRSRTFSQPDKAEAKRIVTHVFAKPQLQGKLTLNVNSGAGVDPGKA